MIVNSTTRSWRLILAATVTVSVTGAYLAAGMAIYAIVGDPIVSTLLLNVLAAVLVMTLTFRWVRLKSFVPAATPCSSRDRLRFGVMAAGSLALAFAAGQTLSQWVTTHAGNGPGDSSASDADPWLLSLALYLLLAPVAEELVFRGLLYPLLLQLTGVPVAVLLSTTVFSLLHGDPAQIVAVVPLSIVLALLYERTGSILIVITAHLAFNLAALLIPAELVAAATTPFVTTSLLAAFCLILPTLRGTPQRERG